MSRATAPLAQYDRDVDQEPLVFTERGQPVAALVDVRDVDIESLSLATNPRFMAIIERSRARLRAEGGIPLAEVKRQLGMPAARTGRRVRPAVGRRRVVRR